MAHYIHDEKNNRIEGMSKEEIYALLAEAIQEGEMPSVDTPTAFVTMIKSIVDGNPYKIGLCTQAEYNDLEAQGLLETDALYIITDDETYNDLVNYINTQDAALSDRITANANNIATNAANIATNTNDINALKQMKLYRHDIELLLTQPITPYDQIKVYFSLDSTISNEINSFDGLVQLLGLDKKIGSTGYISTQGGGYDFVYSFKCRQNAVGQNKYHINDADYEPSNFTITDTPTLILDASVYIGISNPTVSYVETGEQGGLSYADVVITNPNATALTLYYKTSTDANYSTTTIAANGTYTIGNYVEGTSGTVYLSNGTANSNIINWLV